MQGITEYEKVEITVDSAATNTVCPEDKLKEVETMETETSKANGTFTVANGGK